MAMLFLQCARTMTCLWIWLLEVRCGCGASVACAPMFANYPLFSNVMIKFILVDGAAVLPGVWILLVFPVWILGTAVWWPLCVWPTM